MGVVDRVNAWVMSRIAPRAGAAADAGPTTVSWDAAGLRFSDGRQSWAPAWQDVTRVTAYSREQPAGRTLCLALAFAEGRQVEFNEGMAEWPALLRELPARLPLSCSTDEALVRLVADPARPVDLLSR